MALTDWERDLCASVSKERLMEATAGIARWVRLSGTPDELEAARYAQSLLEAAGLSTSLTLHDAYISLPGPAHLEAADGAALSCITHSFGASTGSDGIEGEVVDCGAGSAKELELAAGKIALIDGLAMAGRVSAAEAVGAIAQVYVNGRWTHEMIVSTVWGSPGASDVGRLPRTPIVSITGEVADQLRRKLDTGGRRLRIFAEVDTGWRQTPLLTAELLGRESEFVLFSGHLDSWHFGAMDNGSANATMVEVARLLAGERHRLRRSLRLAFWSGHSHGRYSGSAWYADNNWLELTTRCVAHVNVDSVGGRGASVLSEGIATAALRELGAEAIGQFADQEFRGPRPGRSGDQSFLGHGIPSLWMSLSEQPPSDDPTAKAFAHLVSDARSGGLGWWWHTTEDTIDKLDPDFVVRDARIYVAALSRLLSADLLPISARAEVGDFDRLLGLAEESARGRIDLSEARATVRELLEETAALENWARVQGATAEESQIRAYNRAVRGVVAALLPVSYTTGGAFRPDPASSVPALPLLAGIQHLVTLDRDSDEARHQLVDLTRARNRVMAALVSAREATRSWLAVVGQSALEAPAR